MDEQGALPPRGTQRESKLARARAGTVDKVGRLELLWEERRQLVPYALRR